MVDVKDIQLFLGSLLVNECPCIKIASSLFERNIPLRLQNVAKISFCKMLQNWGVEELSERGEILKKGEVKFEGGK